jgi:tRNA(fMet)-specific endonuclease VapC
MVKYLLDSNACIVYLRTPRNPVQAHVDLVPQTYLRMCSVVKGELLAGAMRYADPSARLQRLDEFFAPFESLPFDDADADVYGRIRADLQRAGKLIGPNDLMIAAIALANDLTLVTHNTGEFARIPGLALEDWQV